MTVRRAGPLPAALLGTVALLATLLTVSPSAADPGNGNGSDRAEQALARVEALLASKPRTREDPRGLTVALRDLARLRKSLSGGQRQQAESYLARPTGLFGDGLVSGFPGNHKQHCSEALCVRYTTGGGSPHRTSNTYAAQAFDLARHVHATYVGAGYRPPKRDAGEEGSDAVDIYLADVGGQAGYYGYCVPEEWTKQSYAYCVVDNDYDPSEYGDAKTPVQNLKVTLAHEYFHAVQFNYDARLQEPGWWMEATATWAEDEVFDGVNDNVQFLQSSPLTQPHRPLTTHDQSGFQYGTWIWFRHLTERWTKSHGGMPILVRQMWRAAGRDANGLGAVKRVLHNWGKDFDRTLAGFGAANRRPRAWYSEGRQQGYPVSPLAGRHWIGKRRRASGSFDTMKLSNRTLRATPRHHVRGRAWKARVVVTTHRPGATEALVTVRWRGGGVGQRRVRIGRDGRGRVVVPFNRRQVKHLELTLTNVGTSGHAISYRVKSFRR